VEAGRQREEGPEVDIGGTISGAVFSESECRRFRFALWRVWDQAKPALLFIGLNPSTATEYQDDPTIVRVARFARENGWGGLFVGNLFDQVTANPGNLDMTRDQASNDEALRQMRGLCSATLAGWGHFGDLARTRPEEVLALVGNPVLCLGKTKDGWPKHPLYLKADTPFITYERGTI